MNTWKKLLFLAPAIVLLATVALVAFDRDRVLHWLGAQPAGMVPEATPEAGTRKQLWTCGMHPHIIREEPGICPICHMDLVPMKDGTAGAPSGDAATQDSSAITIDPSVVQNMGIRTTTVERQTIRRVIRTVGHVDYDEERIAEVTTKITGWVERLYVDQTGQRVRKGQPMLEVYSPELVSTQQEYLDALRYRDQLAASTRPRATQAGHSLVELTRRRLEYWDVSKAQIDELERSGEIQKTLVLYAPASGVVIDKQVFEGAQLMPGMRLFRIADLSRVWVQSHIYEFEVPWVEVGQRAEMELSYVPGRVFEGQVAFIYPFLEKKTRDVVVRLEFPNIDEELKPNMYAQVRILPEVEREGLVIPQEAVIRSGTRNIVFVALDGGRFSPRDVTLGVQGENDTYQVLSGLTEGETVVVSGQFLLDSESRLQEAIQKMLAATEVPEMSSVIPEQDVTAPVETVTASPALATFVDSLLVEYLRVHEALSKDLEPPRAALDQLVATAPHLVHQGQALSPEDEARLSELATGLADAAGAMTEAPDLAAAREAFRQLSKVAIELHRSITREGTSSLAVFYCPDAKAPWIQDGLVTANPYYGSAMFSCGYPLDDEGS